jgi:hypothetical protein
MEEQARSQAPAPALTSVVVEAVAAEVEDNTVPVVDIQYYTPSACSMAVRLQDLCSGVVVHFAPEVQLQGCSWVPGEGSPSGEEVELRLC